MRWRRGATSGVVHPGVCALACRAAGLRSSPLGSRKFIACGGAGVLDREIAVGHIIVPVSAVRDEGTSYHYLPPAREVEASPAGSQPSSARCRRGVPYVLGKTWTTDAIFRETPAKVQLRRAEGCLTVEMEAAAFFAVAQFRGVTFAQMLYGGDDVSGAEWTRAAGTNECRCASACSGWPRRRVWRYSRSAQVRSLVSLSTNLPVYQSTAMHRFFVSPASLRQPPGRPDRRSGASDPARAAAAPGRAGDIAGRPGFRLRGDPHRAGRDRRQAPGGQTLGR